jgi:hypothetical protein
MSMEPWWDYIDRGNWRTRRKAWLSTTLFTTNHTWIDPGANPDLRGEKPATNGQRSGYQCFGEIKSLHIQGKQADVVLLYQQSKVSTSTIDTKKQ